MDFGGFFLFGLLALALALYVAYALYSVLKGKKPLKSYLRGIAVLFALTVLLGGWLFYIYGLNEPLASAAQEGDLPRVRFLLRIGGSPNAVGVDNMYTALTGAAEAGHSEIVRLLLQKGADPFLKDGEGQSAMDCVKRNGHTDIVRMLEEAQRNRRK
ncbi:MAG TPA: ankyrin repeat domain-containing protein [Candidatus Acidoferrum sp.]